MKFCNLRNYFLILLLLCIFFQGVGGRERPPAKFWVRLKGFTTLAWENISTSGSVALVQVACSSNHTISPRRHIIILCLISPSWSELIEQLGSFHAYQHCCFSPALMWTSCKDCHSSAAASEQLKGSGLRISHFRAGHGSGDSQSTWAEPAHSRAIRT